MREVRFVRTSKVEGQTYRKGDVGIFDERIARILEHTGAIEYRNAPANGPKLERATLHRHHIQQQ